MWFCAPREWVWTSNQLFALPDVSFGDLKVMLFSPLLRLALYKIRIGLGKLSAEAEK